MDVLAAVGSPSGARVDNFQLLLGEEARQKSSKIAYVSPWLNASDAAVASSAVLLEPRCHRGQSHETASSRVAPAGKTAGT